MLTVFAMVVVAAVPFAAVFALFAWTDRRRRQRRDVEIGQIALTDRIHERFGAVAAPVLCRRRDGWQVRIAVPVDRPALTKALLDVVFETISSRERHRSALRIIVTRQPQGATSGAGVGFRWESLPCT